jgi:hypothetical protein
MGGNGFSETFKTIYQITWHGIPGDSNLQGTWDYTRVSTRMDSSHDIKRTQNTRHYSFARYRLDQWKVHVTPFSGGCAYWNRGAGRGQETGPFMLRHADTSPLPARPSYVNTLQTMHAEGITIFWDVTPCRPIGINR